MKRFLITLASLSVLAAAQAASAASFGDFLRADYSEPYMLGDAQSRLAFPDDLTVRTWGNPLAQEVPVSTLSRLDLKGIMPLREGSYLVKFGTDPQVYAVSPGGALHWIEKPELAAALYGSRWERKVVTLFSSYYPNYVIGKPISEAEYPEGTIFKYANAPVVYYLTNGVQRAFASEAAFKANHFSFDSVLTVDRSHQYHTGNPVTGYERDLHLVIPFL